MAAGKEKESWVKIRHLAFKGIVLPFVWLLCRLKYGARCERFVNQGKRPYLVLYNHQTPYDQFFPYLSFSGRVYCVATEDIFSNGFTSRLISFMFNPIPIQKRVVDLQAIRNIVKVAKEGGTIAIAPEGNRTYSGKTEHISESIVKLVKMIKLPLALYRIEGGYGVEPRWSSKARRGKMRCYVSEVIELEEIKAMSDQELYKRITDGLYVNEANADGLYKSDRRAEYMERAVYVCPDCGLAEFKSEGNEVKCLSCGKRIEYGEDKRLKGKGFSFSFEFFNDWYEYQNEFVRSLDLKPYEAEEMFTDQSLRVSEVIPRVRKNLIHAGAELKLFGNRIEMSISSENHGVSSGREETETIYFDDVDGAAVLGRNKMNITFRGKTLQFKGEKSFNALKYINIIYHYKNQKNGETDGEFLGL